MGRGGEEELPHITHVEKPSSSQNSKFRICDSVSQSESQSVTVTQSRRNSHHNDTKQWHTDNYNILAQQKWQTVIVAHNLSHWHHDTVIQIINDTHPYHTCMTQPFNHPPSACEFNQTTMTPYLVNRLPQQVWLLGCLHHWEVPTPKPKLNPVQRWVWQSVWDWEVL